MPSTRPAKRWRDSRSFSINAESSAPHIGEVAFNTAIRPTESSSAE